MVRFAGSQFPRAIFPSMVGRPVLRSDEKVQGIQIKDIMVGDDASRARQNLKINLPMGKLHLRIQGNKLKLPHFFFFRYRY